jgi:hypothetical protein
MKNTALDQWQAWKDAGNAPKSRMACLRIIHEHTGAEIRKMKGAASLEESLDGSEKVDDRLSTIVWDLTENGGRLYNYDKDTALFRDLLRQAAGFFYERPGIKPGARGYLEVDPEGYVAGRTGERLQVKDLKKHEIRKISERWICKARNMIARWMAFDKIAGKDAAFILRQIADEVETRTA